MSNATIVRYDGMTWSVLRVVDDFGFQTFDLVSPPRRLLPIDDVTPLLEGHVDLRRGNPLLSPAEALAALASRESWIAASARTIARLFAAFLVAEDPQGRLEAKKAASLMHQLSLVQHVLNDPNLRKVLIADEVGLGKTIEAGLLVRRLTEQRPLLRTLYLAPARLVGNVVSELRQKLDLDARSWVAGTATNARLESDRLIVASIHKAVLSSNAEHMLSSGPWDVLVVDECHHLSDWALTGGSPNQSFRLVSRLVRNLPPDGRLILMSGTPHQGSEVRFRNLLRLLADDDRDLAGARGRVIYRTKDRVRDWRNKPLFPSRDVRQPTVVQLGPAYATWYAAVGTLYEGPGAGANQTRAASWAKSQALQWTASSVEAGLGFLARLGIRRLRWNLTIPALRRVLEALRPYRGGPANEPLDDLYRRMVRQMGLQGQLEEGFTDAEDNEEDAWRPDAEALVRVLDQGIHLLGTEAATAKWDAVGRLIDAASNEKVVLFAQPVETVGVVATHLTQRYGEAPAIIIGNQSEDERTLEVRRFQRDDGPRFLVSSRAGGEGLNMQRARRLIHLDVPWNPMELEQRVGRIHRFGSRKTVIVDTIVAAGSREVDMYRVAREKLSLVATHLAPEEFETLFSRVMSLVPPRELEEVLGSTPAGPLPDTATNEIGRLVTEGYRTWSAFDAAYRGQAEQIRSMDAGQAMWSDLGQFLIKQGHAAPASDVSVTAFEYREDEIVAVDETLPALVANDRLYVCGDTGGLVPEPVGGAPVEQLGTNLPEVRSRLREAFLSEEASGVAFVRMAPDLQAALRSQTSPIGVIALLRQSVRIDQGKSTEHRLSLHVFAIDSQGGEARELAAQQRAGFARACLSATRLREPLQTPLIEQLKKLERELIQTLRQPSNEDMTERIRHAVWPIAAMVIV